MKKLMATVSEWLSKGENVIMVTIIADSGSTPRGAGARMAIISDGSFTGTIGGGAVEYKVQQMAMEAFVDKNVKSQIKSFILSPNEKEDLGMICGGNVTVYIQYISARDENARKLFARGSELFSQNIDSWLVTEITDEADWRMSIHTPDSNNCSSIPGNEGKELFTNRGAQIEMGSGKKYYSEPLTRAGRVYIFGGGHISQELAPLLPRLGFSCFVFDSLQKFANAELFPAADGVIVGDYDDISASVDITEKDYVVILTRGHSFDFSVLAQTLRLQPKPRYIGVIGSKAKIAAVSKKLREQNFLQEEIDSIHTPIGIDIKAGAPAEIAVSIAAELIMIRAESTLSHQLGQFCY
ncbi:MAG: XdhC family protein [Synergistaceae bacterium]|nr:XdhC family protein [Synergistaceae bacterium]